MGAQYGELDIEGRVEHDVGTLLIREYPLVLSLHDILPLGNGLLSGKGSLIVVAYNATQQAVVANGNPVVVVEGDTGQCRNIDLVFQCVRKLFCQQRI